NDTGAVFCVGDDGPVGLHVFEPPARVTGIEFGDPFSQAFSVDMATIELPADERAERDTADSREDEQTPQPAAQGRRSADGRRGAHGCFGSTGGGWRRRFRSHSRTTTSLGY